MSEESIGLPDDQRDALRQRILTQGGWYSPWLHLGITSSVGIAVVAAGVALLHDVKWGQIVFGIVLFLMSNAAEWWLHREFLHRRRVIAPILYDRHTPEHHMIYLTDDMSIRSPREMRLVLMPAFGIVALFCFVLLPGIVMIWLGWPIPFFAPPVQHNLACIFAIETMGYVVTYEWLHLSYHLPPESFIGSLAIIRILRRHHAIHHDPRLMQRWNFNVSLPLWDLVRGTCVTDRNFALAAPRSQARVS